MGILTFKKGGVKPLHKQHEGKPLACDKPIRVLDAPKVVAIPMTQNIGMPAHPCVKVGDTVCVGQPIGQPAGFVGATVHASVSGKVTAIKEMLHVTGAPATHVVIENDGAYTLYEEIHPRSQQEIDNLSSQEIIEIIQSAGIVGAGGATFPTHVKLSIPQGKKVDTLLINGAECEPFLTADERMMLEHPDQVVKGAELAMNALGLNKTVIGIEQNKMSAVQTVENAAKGHRGISVQIMRTRYPQGSEKQLIQTLTGREVPDGGLPMDCGCVVLNVGTAAAIYQAVYQGMPMVQRVVTVTGGVQTPQNLLVRIGTTFEDCIQACGGFKGKTVKVISGGPMMGVAQTSTEVSCVKGTSGILVLNEEMVNPLPETACIHCGKCVAVCPVGLMPFELDQLFRKKDFERAEEAHAMSCMECGSCTYICPSKRYLVQSIRLAKGEIGRLRRERAAAAKKEEEK